MKRFDFVFTILQVPLDYLMLVVAGLASYSLRYQGLVTQVRPVFFDVSYVDFVRLLFGVALIGILVFAWSGLYRSERVLHSAEEFRKIFLAVSTTLLIVVIAIFLRRELFSSRFIILLAWIFAVIFISIGRVALRYLKGIILSHSSWGYSIALIGNGESVQIIQHYYQNKKHLGYHVQAVVPDFSPESRAQLEALARADKLDELVQLRTDFNEAQTEEVITFCNTHQVNLLYLASFVQTQLINYEAINIAGYPIIRVKRTPLDGWGRIGKRLFDVVVSAVALIILSPLFLIVMLIVRFDSRGPILFAAMRVGQKGKIFKLYKFRSMIVGADKMKQELAAFNERADGPLFKMTHDPRITSAGRWLRRSSLDELPQLWNVLVGDMSLVGPRPHEPEEVSRYTSQYRKLLTIKPGITGAAQVSGRSTLTFDEEARLDIYYIENWSLWQDIRILAKTPAALINYRNAS